MGMRLVAALGWVAANAWAAASIASICPDYAAALAMLGLSSSLAFALAFLER